MPRQRGNPWKSLPYGPLIAPSLLACDFAHMGLQIDAAIAAGADVLHVDIMDGHFVPNLSMGPPVARSVRKYTDHPMDVHIMVTDPAYYIEKFADVGADSITFHIEATDAPRELIDRLHERGLGAGITLKPGTPAESIKDVATAVDMVLVMTVEPGYGGQKFMDDMLPKIAAVRRMLRNDQRLEVDGGIRPATAALCAAQGADVFVAGEDIFGSADIPRAVRDLRAAANVKNCRFTIDNCKLNGKDNAMQLDEAINLLRSFQEGDELTKNIAKAENLLKNCNKQGLVIGLKQLKLSPQLLRPALLVKGLVGQINVIIHALGILAALPKILEEDEQIESISLGAGNTGRQFDLETNRRIAEFKFINWRGGPESIRQNAIFKDFFELAEANTDRDRYLYVIGLTHPLEFLKSRRALKSVLSKNDALQKRFYQRYQDTFQTVGEYFQHRQRIVKIEDITNVVPEFTILTD